MKPIDDKKLLVIAGVLNVGILVLLTVVSFLCF